MGKVTGDRRNRPGESRVRCSGRGLSRNWGSEAEVAGGRWETEIVLLASIVRVFTAG